MHVERLVDVHGPKRLGDPQFGEDGLARFDANARDNAPQWQRAFIRVVDRHNEQVAISPRAKISVRAHGMNDKRSLRRLVRIDRRRVTHGSLPATVTELPETLDERLQPKRIVLESEST